MCESGLLASFRSSRRSFSVSGAVKIALAGTRFSSRDDADFFFTIFFLNRVNHQQERDSAGQTDCMPAFLIIYNRIQVRHRPWINKDPRGGSERNVVLSLVDAVLAFIHTNPTCIYRIVARKDCRGLPRASMWSAAAG